LFQALKRWLEARRAKKRQRYAEELGWMDREELQRVREEHTPRARADRRL